MKLLYSFLFLLLIFIIPLAISPLTFEVVRIKFLIFELVLPWLFLYFFYFNKKEKFRTVFLFPSSILVFIALFFIAGIFFYFRSQYKTISSEKELLNALFFVFLLMFFKENPRSDKIHKVIFISSVLVFLYGLFQILGLNFTRHWMDYFQNRRIFSTLANPNNLAFYCNVIFFLGLYYVLEHKNKYLIVLVLFAFLSLVFTKSISGILSFIVGLLFFSLSFRRRIRIFYIALFLSILLMVFYSGAHFKSNSLSYRLCLWKSTARIIAEKPILGWGLGSFPYVYPGFRNPVVFYFIQDPKVEIVHPESYFLNLMVEGGSIYLLLFLLMNFALIYRLLNKRSDRICFYYALILIVMLFQNIISDNFYSFTPFFIYLVLFGLGLRKIARHSEERIRLDLDYRVLNTFFVILLSANIIISFYAVSLFRADFYLRKAVFNSQIRRFSLAEKQYQESIRYNYFRPLTHYLLAQTYLEEGGEKNLYQALKFCNNTENLAGNYLELYFLKGLIFGKLGLKKLAKRYLEKASLSNPYFYLQSKTMLNKSY